jgi:hypothetical protein
MKTRAVLLSVLFSAAATPLFCQWNYLPAGHATPTAVTSDVSMQTIWVGTAGAGMWKTMDGGYNWNPVNQTIPLPVNYLARQITSLDAQCDTMILHAWRMSSSQDRFY